MLKMTKQRDQTHLARKFALDWHLDVKDRRALLDGVLNGRLVCDEILKILDVEGWYPSTWKPELDFDGGLIQKMDSGCRIHWKAEIGVMRYALVEVEDFESIEDGVSSFSKRFFGNEFDDIKIDWA